MFLTARPVQMKKTFFYRKNYPLSSPPPQYNLFSFNYQCFESTGWEGDFFVQKKPDPPYCYNYKELFFICALGFYSNICLPIRKKITRVYKAKQILRYVHIVNGDGRISPPCIRHCSIDQHFLNCFPWNPRVP